MAPLQAKPMLLDGMAGPTPLLELPLPGSPGGTPTAFASRTQRVMDHMMLAQEEILRPFGPGLHSWALPLDPGCKTCRRRLFTSFATTNGTINRKQMSLPSNDLTTPEAVEGPVPRVFLMCCNTFSGS